MPRTTLLAERNPTCDLRTYAGGLSSCHHGWILLDKEQSVPWPTQPLVYYKKYRVWFQEYASPPAAPPSHINIIRQDWGVGADYDHAEYDVMQCAKGTPPAQCKRTVSGAWRPLPPAATPADERYLVLVHHHCHAPTCLRVELWNNDTGSLLCAQEPLYGGVGHASLRDFDEPGYIAIPDCFWGGAENGLEPPPDLTGVPLHVVKTANATLGHYGEMSGTRTWGY